MHTAYRDGCNQPGSLVSVDGWPWCPSPETTSCGPTPDTLINPLSESCEPPADISLCESHRRVATLSCRDFRETPESSAVFKVQFSSESSTVLYLLYSLPSFLQFPFFCFLPCTPPPPTPDPTSPHHHGHGPPLQLPLSSQRILYLQCNAISAGPAQ